MSVNEVKLKRAPTEFEVRGTGHPGSRTFAIGDEDHTLGNALRHVLMQNANVGFAGYSVPHPSEPLMHLRLQTVENKETGEQLTAIEALKEACATLSDQCDFVVEELEKMVPAVKEDKERIQKLMESDFMEEEEGGGGEYFGE
eukprot:CAMPEP_0172495622 /NCGR_PEP_ID=MMETSP1066-20121228/73014_1 /TAXON_ID=671091 /ORGANISM="Coscinodiscus wailesii, Strain CCMP2513" /LENGTH=142 /DNA_ID=CAMNT_0013267409 /DNA_START=119 /DNA_END=544 /DNA_ORIENTATION=+